MKVSCVSLSPSVPLSLIISCPPDGDIMQHKSIINPGLSCVHSLQLRSPHLTQLNSSQLAIMI